MEIKRVFDLLQNYMQKYPNQQTALAGKKNGAWVKYSIKDYIEDIVAHGVIISKVTLGVHLVDITDQRTALSYRVDEMGVYILSVQENSNAAYAGLQSGDRIVTVDGQEVESSQQVIDIIATQQIGDVLEMDIVRRGEQQHLSITMYGPNQDPGSIQQT